MGGGVGVGESSFCAPIGPNSVSAAVTSDPATPAALNGQGSLSDSLQNSSARHDTVNIPGNRNGSRELEAAELQRRASTPALVIFFPLHDTGLRGSGAPTVQRVYECLFPGLDHDDAKCGGPADRESCEEFTGDSWSATAT